MHEITLARLERMKRGDPPLASLEGSISVEDHTLADAVLDIHGRLKDLEEEEKNTTTSPGFVDYKVHQVSFDGVRAHVLFGAGARRDQHRILGVRLWDPDDDHAFTQEMGNATESQWLEGYKVWKT